MTNRWRHPLFSSGLGPAEAEAAASVVKGGWLTCGPKVEAFERAFASAMDLPDAVMVSSGTAALHLALLACGVGPGDEVIVPSLTFVAAAAVVRQVGARPVFADVISPERPHVDPAAIELLITPATRVLMVMDYSGLAGEQEAYVATARRHRLTLVEDAAHVGWPGLWARRVGQEADFTCFSFYSTKPLGLGEGGMVVGRRLDELAAMRRWRSHDLSITASDRAQRATGDYDVLGVGYNYRPTEISAAMGLSRSQRVSEEWGRRRAAAERYALRLRDVPGVATPLSFAGDSSAHHLMPLLLDPQIDRAAFVDSLHSNGIQTGRHYIPIHTFSAYREGIFRPPHPLPQTEEAFARLVSLPMHSDLPVSAVDEICGVIEKAVRNRSSR